MSSEILCNKYQIYRKDRPNRIGGGVLIAVSSCLTSELLISSIDLEFICVLIKINTKKLFITCSYIPPNSNQLVYSEHVAAINSVVSSASSNDFMLVVGDFNLPFVKWDFVPDSPNLLPISSNSWTDTFFNALSDLCLFQLNSIRNINDKLLDLVFVSDPAECQISRIPPVTTPEDRYHPTLEIICPLPNDAVHEPLHVNTKCFNFKKSNYAQLNLLFAKINWNNIISVKVGTPDYIDRAVQTFYDTIYTCMNKCIPQHIPYKHSGSPWCTRELSRLKNIKNKVYKKYKISGSAVHYEKYSVYRAEYNLLNKLLYESYLSKIKNNFKCDPKSFYKFVNSKRKSTAYPSTMKYGGRESADDKEICNMFADFFATTYSDVQYDDTEAYPYQIRSHGLISLPTIDSSAIKNGLKKLKLSYSDGPDRIPSCILINCADTLTTPLTILFNTSIKYGYFPKFWKESYIIPLFKSGNKSQVTNYRGIAKLSAIPKLFEKCITDNFSHSISSLISPYQHGFRKRYSTSTNLLEFTSSIHRGFVLGKFTDTIYTDFSKAFDRVNHDLLLKKLDLMGLSYICLKWIKSYLIDRKQSVRLNNTRSSGIDVLSGVPQGSHLGPILFSLFINDMPTVIQFSNILMYADDIKIFNTFNHSSQSFLLQSDLNNFFNWCVTNLMDLNLNKCKHMRFSRTVFALEKYRFGVFELESVVTFQDLGFLLDPKLDFKSHITMTVNKARGVLAFIKRWAKEFTDPYITKQLYTSLVRPILEYGSVVWDPCYDVHSNSIESVQKQFLLFALRSLPWSSSVNLPPYTSRLALIKLPTLKSRRTMLNITFLINLINGDVCSEFLLSRISFNVPLRPSRYFNIIQLQYFRVNYANSEPFRKICNDFNNLYSLIDFSLNVNLIKNNVIQFLNSN